MIAFYSSFQAIVASLAVNSSNASLEPSAGEMVQHFQKQLFFCHSQKAGGNRTDTVLPSAKGFDLKAEIPEILFVCLQQILLLKAE